MEGMDRLGLAAERAGVLGCTMGLAEAEVSVRLPLCFGRTAASQNGALRQQPPTSWTALRAGVLWGLECWLNCHRGCG